MKKLLPYFLLFSISLIFQTVNAQFGSDFGFQAKVKPATTSFVYANSLSSNDAIVLDNYLYVSYGNGNYTFPKGSLIVYDISTPSVPSIVKELTFTDRYLSDMVVEAGVLYVVGSGLSTFDVGNLANPVETSFYLKTTLVNNTSYVLKSREIEKRGPYLIINDFGYLKSVYLATPTSQPTFVSQRTTTGGGHAGIIFPTANNALHADDYHGYEVNFSSGGVITRVDPPSTTAGTFFGGYGEPQDLQFAADMNCALMTVYPILPPSRLMTFDATTKATLGYYEFPWGPGNIQYLNGVALVKHYISNKFLALKLNSTSNITLIKEYPVPPESSLGWSGLFRFFPANGTLIVGDGKNFDIYKSGTQIPVLSVTNVSPTSGPVGTAVTITGTNFSTTATSNSVKFGATTATVTTSTATSITTTVPAGAITGKITVTVGANTATSPVDFTVTTGSPTITSFSPLSGSAGTTVIISGSNFSTTPTSNIVKFSGTVATVTASTATSITTTVPAGAINGKVTVTVGTSTATSATDFTVTAAGSPSITSFTPATGQIGTTVTILGTNFSTTIANNIVKFNGTPAVITGTTTATSITTTVPIAATSGKITVEVGGQIATSITDFAVVIPALTITSFTPTNSQIGGVVTITGTNFSSVPANNVVKFNGVTASIVSSTAISIVTKVPTGATTGPITVTTGTLTATSATNFLVCPIITLTTTTTNKASFTFSATGGQAPYTYSLDGVNFQSASNFNLSAGIYSVTAKDANGCTGSTDFKVNGTLDCGVTQAAGGQGTSFTTHILGSGSGLVRIEYEMYPNPDQMDVYYDNQLVASTNTLVSNKGFLSFNYSYNPSKPTFCVIKIYAPNNGTEWEYAAFCPAVPIPKITSFSPTYGAIASSVTINGYNFNPGSTVKFGSISALSPTVNLSGTQITVKVPQGAVTSPISVTNGVGTGFSDSGFVVSPYCVSGATSASNSSKIDKVIFGSLNNASPSASCGGYSDYTSLVGYLSPGGLYDLKVTLGACTGNFNKAVKAFIDWNGDFDFDDVGELVAVSASSATGTREETFPIIVPNALAVSSTRLRIVLRETSTPSSITACSTYSFGETEDYTLSFIPSGTASKNISVSALADFETFANIPSAPKSFVISGANLGTNPFNITSPNQFQVSKEPSTGFSSSLILAPNSGSINTLVYVRYAPNEVGQHIGNIVIANSLFTTSSNVSVAGKAVNATASFTTFASFDEFTTTDVGIASTSQKFRINASGLSGNVTVTSPPNFEISSTSSSFSTSLVLIPTQGKIADQIMNVRYKPTTLGLHAGNIVIATAGIADQSIALNGKISSAKIAAITSLEPSSGLEGTTVIISGVGFSTTTPSVVKFNGISAVIKASNATSITTSVPVGAKTGRVTITSADQSISSNFDFIVYSSAIPVPVAQSATAISSSGFTASWASVQSASGYQLDISTDNFATFVTGYNSKNINNTSQVVTGLNPGVGYTYRVRAVMGSDVSANSNLIFLTTTPAINAPVATTATAISLDGFTANWNAVTGATGYKLDVSADNFVTLVAGFNDKAITGITSVVTGLTFGTAYKYRVRAVDANGTSVNSNVIDVTTLAKQNQTIAFTALADKTLGDASFALTANASSNLAVAFSTTSDKITISGSQVTLVKAGRASIVANQAGNDAFNAAEAVTQSFCIKPAKPNVTLSNTNTETVTLTSNASAGNQWYLAGVAISGATNTTLAVTAPGVYKVQVKVDDCTSEFSADQTIIVTGDIKLDASSVSISPNPVNEVLQLNGIVGEIKSHQLFDMTGRAAAPLTLEKKNDVYQASVEHLNQGVYVLRVVQENKVVQIKFIKK